MPEAGIDVGYRSTKVVLLSEGKILAREESDTAETAFAKALGKANLTSDMVTHVTATGAGRESIGFAQRYTPDIVATAKGAFYLFPSVRTVFDIGSEQGRAIKCDAKGQVLKFAKNEKCAAGAGAFLEYIAKAVGTSIEEMGELALLSRKDVSVSGNCAVFAESEVVSLIHANVDKVDIIRAILDSLAERTAALGDRVNCEEDMVLAGGLGRNVGFAKCLERYLKIKLLIPEYPQFVTALGAALISAESMEAA